MPVHDRKTRFLEADDTARRMAADKKSPTAVKGQQTKVHNMVREYWQSVWNARFAMEADGRKTLYSAAAEHDVDPLDVESILDKPEHPQWVTPPARG